MSLVAQVETPTLIPVYTLELVGNVLLKGWLVHSADAYKLECGENQFIGVKWNGEYLQIRADIATTEANDGSYFEDTDGTVYVNPPTGESIYTSTVQGELLYTFVKGEPKIFDAKTTVARTNCYFESRVDSVPSLSLRIEPRFSGVGQVGGGTCELRNDDGFFDTLTDVDWSRAAFYMGADSTRETMIYNDYQPLGSYRVESWTNDRQKLKLTLKENKTVLSQKLPIETFTREDYPNIGQDEIGKIIPRIYGRVYAAKPVCVDAVAKRFKICGHAVYEISEARIYNDENVWMAVPFATRDEANGEFTLGADWTNQEVCVDLIGVKTADGKPMYNWADVVQDILEYLGETDFDTASFDDSYDALTVGTYDTGQLNTHLKASIYIKEATAGLDLVGKACNAAGAFLYVNASGEWHFEVFEPKVLGDIAASYTDDDILPGTFNRPTDMREVFSKVSVKFAHRHTESWSQNVIEERDENRLRAAGNAEILKEIDAPLFDERDAAYYAQRILTTDAEPLARFQFSVKWRGLLRKPGEQIKVTFDAQGLTGIYEILEARHDLNANRVTLTCGDRRAWADSFGWWVADSVADWNAAGTATEKREAKQSAGFWHGDDSLAVSTDSDSHNVSRWY